MGLPQPAIDPELPTIANCSAEDLPQTTIDPELPTIANCSAEDLPQTTIDPELPKANCPAEDLHQSRIDCELPTAKCPEELQPQGIAELALFSGGAPPTETSETSSVFDGCDLVASDCPATCCSNLCEVYQPKQVDVLKDLSKKGRNFMISWYTKYPWITLCLTKKKVFCIYCRYAHMHKTLTFSTKYNNAFTQKGYDNMKKALENFQAHDMTPLNHIWKLN